MKHTDSKPYQFGTLISKIQGIYKLGFAFAPGSAFNVRCLRCGHEYHTSSYRAMFSHKLDHDLKAKAAR